MTKDEVILLVELLQDAIDEDMLVVGGEAMPRIQIHIVHVEYKPGSRKILMRLGNQLMTGADE